MADASAILLASKHRTFLSFAKLRKVLCVDARSMADASAKEIKDTDNDLSINKYNEQNVA